MFFKFSASFLLGAVILTNSQPALIILIDSSTVAIVSIVSVVVIDCTLIGLFPPKPSLPTITSRVLNRENEVNELQYFIIVLLSFYKFQL